jgi:hypothetical protein
VVRGGEMVSIGEWLATSVTSFRFPTPKLIERGDELGAGSVRQVMG